jgi:hypothetical protein
MINDDQWFDSELAETLSLIVHRECAGAPLDIGIELAIACHRHAEIIPLGEEDLDELQG